MCVHTHTHRAAANQMMWALGTKKKKSSLRDSWDDAKYLGSGEATNSGSSALCANAADATKTPMLRLLVGKRSWFSLFFPPGGNALCYRCRLCVPRNESVVAYICALILSRGLASFGIQPVDVYRFAMRKL